MRVTLLVVTVLVTTEAISLQQPDDELREMQKESARLSQDRSVQVAIKRKRRFLSSLLKKFLPTIIKAAPTIIKHAPSIIKTVKKLAPTIIKAAPTIMKAAPTVIKMLTSGTSNPKKETVIKVKETVPKKPLFSAGECPRDLGQGDPGRNSMRLIKNDNF